MDIKQNKYAFFVVFFLAGTAPKFFCVLCPSNILSNIFHLFGQDRQFFPAPTRNFFTPNSPRRQRSIFTDTVDTVSLKDTFLGCLEFKVNVCGGPKSSRNPCKRYNERDF